MAENPNIPYAGHVLPRDAGKVGGLEKPNPNVPYAGNTLPQNAKVYQPFKDPFNTPGTILMNNGVQEIALPPDTIILPDAGKRLAMGFILDGASVFERIQTKPVHMEFRGTFRMQDIGGIRYNNTTPPAGATGFVNNIFPQEYINDVWTYVFQPNTIITVKNSFLNGIGIQQLIIEDFQLEPVPSSKNVGYRITAYQNVVGQSLIISG